MPHPIPAVFLSYASQDAASATCIAEALRAAGIEVWFDKSELVGGDAWDAKIRGQIKACTLFVPLISANTQARAEGYFRLEWHLAEQRTYLMAHDQPFLFPVVADATTDVEARVPERFRERQWMRLDNTSPEAIAQRIAVTLTGPTKPTAAVAAVGLSDVASANSDDTGVPSRTSPSAPGTAPIKTTRPWLIPSVIGIIAVVALAFWQPWQSSPDSNLPPVRHPVRQSFSDGGSPASGDEGGSDVASTTAEPALSAVDSLLAKIWDQLNTTGLDKSNLDLAAELCDQALELDRNNAEIWAVYSQVDTWMAYHKLDPSDERRASAREKVGRALQLAPDSYEARLAQACFTVRGGGASAFSANAQNAETILLELIREQPTEPRALFALGILYRNAAREGQRLDGISQTSDPATESIRLLTELSRHPTFAALAWHEIAWVHYLVTKDFGAVDAALDRSIAIESLGNSLILKLIYAKRWHGDLDAAVEIFHLFPSSVRKEDKAVMLTYSLFYWKRDTERMLQILSETPRDWLASNAYRGPKRLLTGDAYAMAGRMGAARVEWQAALDRLNTQLQEENNNTELLNLKGELLWKLGNQSESAKVYQLASEFRNEPNEPSLGQSLREGNLDEALRLIEEHIAPNIQPNLSYSAASLRLDPFYDPIRDHPRFQALLAQAEADPRLTPNPTVAASVTAPEKSIAVLPLANMSPDAENAFFADGVHEDILGNLAKVRDLFVISRTSTLQYRDTVKTMGQIGTELGVRYLVEGSVRRAANQVLVSVQLIDSTTDQPVWSEKYNRKLDDIFAIQAEIAQAIAGQLQAMISPDEIAKIEYRPTQNQDAYDSYIKFRNLLTRGGIDSFADKISHLEDAVAHDPEFAEAWALLSVECIFSWVAVSQRNDPALYRRAHEALEQAKRTGPDLSVIPYALSTFALREDNDLELSINYLLQALSTDPGNQLIHWRLGTRYVQLGRLAEAQHHYETSIKLDPLAHGPNNELRSLYMLQHKWDKAQALVAQNLTRAIRTTYWESLAAQTRFIETGERIDLEALWTQDSQGDNSLPAALLDRDFPTALDYLDESNSSSIRFYNIVRSGHTLAFDRDVLRALIQFEFDPESVTSLTDVIAHFAEEDLTPTYLGGDPSLTLSILHALEGDREAMESAANNARAYAGQIFNKYRDSAMTEVKIAIAQLVLGDHDQAIESLEVASKMHSPMFLSRELELWFIFDRLRGNPRFDALLEETE